MVTAMATSTTTFSTDQHLPEPLKLERTDSHPSLTHSTSSDDHDRPPSHHGISSANSDALLTPTSGQHDLSLTRSASDRSASGSGHESPEPTQQSTLKTAHPVATQVPPPPPIPQAEEEGRGRKNRLYFSKSTKELRSKSRDKKDKEVKKDVKKGRNRSATLTEADTKQRPQVAPLNIPPAHSVSASSQPKTASGGFSSFFKKLTGRSDKSSSATTPKKASAAPTQTAPPVPPMPRQTATPAPSNKRSPAIANDVAKMPTTAGPTSVAALGPEVDASKASQPPTAARLSRTHSKASSVEARSVKQSPVVESSGAMVSPTLPTNPPHARNPSSGSARSTVPKEDVKEEMSEPADKAMVPSTTAETVDESPAPVTAAAAPAESTTPEKSKSTPKSVSEDVFTAPMSTDGKSSPDKSPMKRNRGSFTLASAASPPLRGDTESSSAEGIPVPSAEDEQQEEQEQLADDEEIEEVAAESEDVVEPLPSSQLGRNGEPTSHHPRVEPIQIPQRKDGQRGELPSATSVMTSQTGLSGVTQASTSAENETILTPTDGPNEGMTPSVGAMARSLSSGGTGTGTGPGAAAMGRSPSKSPPRYDPVVDTPPKSSTGTGSKALGRKESKWRKSFMALGVSSNKPAAQQQQKLVQRAPVVRKISGGGAPREPPTSYDAYLNQQRRIASNRQSCQPTIHTAGTVAAETRRMKKEEEDMAETFFCS